MLGMITGHSLVNFGLARALPLSASVLALLAASPAIAQTNAWTGDVSTDFNTAGNWTNGAPTGNVVVDFRPKAPVVSGAATVGAAEFRSVVRVATDGALTADTIKQTAAVLYNEGTVTTNAGLTNGSSVENLATAVINGGVKNSDGALLNNAGTINGGVINGIGARFSQRGQLSGGLTNNGIALIEKSFTGDVLNRGTGQVYVYGQPITNDGVFINKDLARLIIYDRFTGLKALHNTATGYADGNVQVRAWSALQAETITNGAGAEMRNAGTISATNPIANSGLVTNLAAGVINGGLANDGQIANDGRINGGIVNSGTVTNAATATINGGIVNSGTVTNLGTVNDAVVQSAGMFDNQGNLRAGVTLNGGVLTSTAATSAIAGGLTNSATAQIAGTLTGPVVNNAGGQISFVGDTHGDGTVNNAAGATIALAGNVDGFNTISNSGAITATGARTIATAGLTNQAGGVISMQNGTAGDQLTISGPYTGAQGSRIAVDVDATKGAAVADKVVVNGTATGATTVAVNVVNGTGGLLTSPVEVVRVGAGSTLTVDTGRVAARPYVNYYVNESAAGSGVYQLTSAFDATPLTGIAGAVSSGLTSFQASLHQPLHPIVARPANCRANQVVVSPFVRGAGGEDRISGKGTAEGGGVSSGATSKTANKLGGIQGGIDIGLCNIADSGWYLHVGGMGGQVAISGATTVSSPGPAGSAASKSRTTSSLTMPFFGAYALLGNGKFNLEMMARHETVDGTLNTTGDGGTYLSSASRLKGQGWSFGGMASYRHVFSNKFYVEPHVGITSGSVRFDKLTLATGSGDTLAFGTASTGLARAGVNLGTSLRMESGLVISPFAHFSVWSRLGGTLTGKAVLASVGETATVKGEAGRTFFQTGAGLMMRTGAGGVSGFVRADMRFGEAVQGYGVSGGLRLTF